MLTSKQKRIFLIFAVVIISFLVAHIAQGQSLSLPDASRYGDAVQDPGIVANSDFSSNFASLVVGLVLNVRYIIGAVAIGIIVFAGFKMVTSQGNEEVWTKQKNALIWGVLGLALVGLSGDIVRIFNVGQCQEMGLLPASSGVGCQSGGFLKDPNTIVQRAGLFNQVIQYIITFIKYIIGTIAVAMIMRTAVRLAANTASEEINKDKLTLAAAIAGLIVIIIADPIINNVLFKIDTSRYPSGGAEVAIDVGQGVREIIGFTNYAVTILTPLAILAIIGGGVLYIASGGDDDMQSKGKRIITLALVGLLIIYGAFAIVSTFISGQFSEAEPTGPLPTELTTT